VLTPRTDPSARQLRTRLPPRASDVKALHGSKVKDAGWRAPGFDEPQHPRPRQGRLRTAPRERTLPKEDMATERRERLRVRGHRAVSEEPGRDLPQPSALLGDWPMHPLPQIILQFLECRPHVVTPGLPYKSRSGPGNQCAAVACGMPLPGATFGQCFAWS
jgi:hypothetical protein